MPIQHDLFEPIADADPEDLADSILAKGGGDLDPSALDVDLSDTPESDTRKIPQLQRDTAIPLDPKLEHFLRLKAQGASNIVAYWEAVNAKCTRKSAEQQASRWMGRPGARARLRVLMLERKAKMAGENPAEWTGGNGGGGGSGNGVGGGGSGFGGGVGAGNGGSAGGCNNGAGGSGGGLTNGWTGGAGAGNGAGAGGREPWKGKPGPREAMTKAQLVAELEKIVRESLNESNRMAAMDKIAKLRGYVKDPNDSRRDIPDPAYLMQHLRRASESNQDPVELARRARSEPDDDGVGEAVDGSVEDPVEDARADAPPGADAGPVAVEMDVPGGGGAQDVGGVHDPA